MTTLTLEAIRENPWNAVTQTLPMFPDWLLLEVAYTAATYCRLIEEIFMVASRTGDYMPPVWRRSHITLMTYTESEARFTEADNKCEEIRVLYRKRFGGLPD